MYIEEKVKYDFLVKFLKDTIEDKTYIDILEIQRVLKALEIEKTTRRIYSPDGTKMVEIKEGETNE